MLPLERKISFDCVNLFIVDYSGFHVYTLSVTSNILGSIDADLQVQFRLLTINIIGWW